MLSYESEIIIQDSRETVITAFDNKENLFKWQETLKSIDHFSGTEGEPGAKSNMVYQNRKSTMILEEEIIDKDLPESMSFVYRSGGVVNRNFHYFQDNKDGTTTWRQKNEFEIRGFFGILARLMPGMFKKQTISDMNKFKLFVESL